MYNRNIALIGQNGQDIMKDSSILVIGAGGIGNPLLMYLTGLGIGTVGIVDNDTVDITNLQRQILFNILDIKRNKAIVAQEKLKLLNPQIKINKYTDDIKNLEQIFDEYDIIADCTDNFTTRRLINKYAVKYKKILFSAAAIGWHGYVLRFDFNKQLSPCYNCFCPSDKIDREEFFCSTNGVLGFTTGNVGILQGTLIIKYLLDIDQKQENMWRLNLRDSTLIKSTITSDSTCHICNK
ncbi:MAG: HesA/MoeB/ThiF family protein [Anaplasmataceae bacterium]|nr:HesA/MoeB/ThiF family protein [Anaplasmataceae bacterium]